MAKKIVSTDFQTKAKINALVFSEISRHTGMDVDEVAVSILDDENGEKPIHKAIRDLAEAIEAHSDFVRSMNVASSPLIERPDYGTRTSILRKKYREETDQAEWALMDSKGKKVLEWYGKKKPSEDRVKKSEKRIQFFKHKGLS